MNVRVTKANAFELKPNTKYLLIIIEDYPWTVEQQDDLEHRLAPAGFTVVFLPKDTKYKIVEGQNVTNGK